MKYHHLVLLCFAFVAIFCTRAAYSDSKVTILNKLDKSVDSMHFSAKKTIELRCITSENGTVTWERGGKSVDSLNDLKDRVEVHKNGNNTLLVLKDMKESDVGNYTCAVYNNGARIAYDTVALATPTSAKWGVRVPKNSNVVEGETLSIKCDVKGDLTLEWWYRNTTSGDNYTQFTDRERVKFEDYYDEDRKVNVTNGIIKIEEVDMGDRGEYMCLGLGDSERHNATSMVRVKDKYAALWPFLGICAEVFVLCAIIFIYEKKRNKTELEESDTDQSPDQKNTPDHGKESNLRHRQ